MADQENIETVDEEIVEEALEVEEETVEPEEVTVSIGEQEEEPEKAPEWVRELRKNHREAQKRIRELESQIPKQNAPKLSAKPALEDFDYDTDKFSSALESWYEEKRQVESAEEQQRRAVEEEQKSWQERLTSYQGQKAGLKVQDFADAEDAVKESLNVVQQGVILQGAENPALVVYALGKNPKKALELANIKDPVKFAFAVAKLEKDLKVTGKRTPPAPEGGTPPSGGAVPATSRDLDKLREQATKSGDWTKYLAAKRAAKK